LERVSTVERGVDLHHHPLMSGASHDRHATRRRLPVTDTTVRLSESTTLTEATVTAPDSKSGRMRVQVITPGWGSSGYYSREVVEAAAPLFKVGTQMFLDHPSATEANDRPERSVRDIAGVITEAGKWDPTLGAVVAECRVLTPYRDALTELADHIGLSIRGSATDVTVGEAEGRTGPIIEGLADITSVDFVTRAGRGGRVLELLESSRPEVIDRAVARGVAEATANERRTQLNAAVKALNWGSNRWSYVRDFDDTEVWFDVSAEDDTQRTYQQSYAVSDDDLSVSLTGTPVEVRPVTKYVAASGTSTTEDATSPSPPNEETLMGQISVDEADHRSVTETAARVPVLETERDTAVRERDAARAERDRLLRESAARKVVTDKAAASGVRFRSVEEKGLLADLPVKDDALDAEAFGKVVDDAITEASRDTGTGSVTGFGGSVGFGGDTGADTINESDIDAAVGGAFGRQPVKGA
jgi:hypothetical protein